MDNFRELCDELRCWDTERISEFRERELHDARRHDARALAATRILDERKALTKDQAARDGLTETNAKRQRDIARKLEQLPHLGNAALNGDLSSEQLAPAAALADEDSDAEITERAKRTTPLELQRIERAQRAKPSRHDSQARRSRRCLRKWVDDDGYLCGRFELPMEHGGAVVDGFFDLVAERMKPATGEAWEPLERRYADILLALCQMEPSGSDVQDATIGARVDVHVDIPLHGPAAMCGVPLPDEWVHAARANARVHIRVVDDDGNVAHEERAKSFVSEKRRRAVVRRDGRCRWPGCPHRLRLQVHHLHPSSWEGPDDISNLAAVCPSHHGLLIPHGDYVLDGNPHQPDGLSLRLVTAEERRQRRLVPLAVAV